MDIDANTVKAALNRWVLICDLNDESSILRRAAQPEVACFLLVV